MAKPEYHVFICTQQRPQGHPRGSCGEKGCGEVYNAFSMAIAKRNLFNKVAVTATGCLGPCQTGANVLVYPGSVMYIQMTPADVDVVIDQHLLGGQPVADKVAPPEYW